MSCPKLIGWCATVLCLMVGTVSGGTGVEDNLINLRLNPNQIDVGIFYHGTEVEVTADIPNCDGAVLIAEGGSEETTFNRKGKEIGIWLNVAQVTISGVPKVYLMGSSKRLDEICSMTTQRELGLGIKSLRDHMKITSEEPLIGSEAEEFFALKTKSGTYNTRIPIGLTPEAGGRQALTATLQIPPTLAPGRYDVLLYCFANGRLIHKDTNSLDIHRVGLASLLFSLAYDSAAAYGIFAVLVAMMVGILMGMIFHSWPGSGH
jgi:uncharacterized protein (TIGR02186 family)